MLYYYHKGMIQSINCLGKLLSFCIQILIIFEYLHVYSFIFENNYKTLLIVKISNCKCITKSDFLSLN